jgi:DNA-3-methyladenine glycosylase
LSLQDLLRLDVHEVARGLLGATLIVDGVGGEIVEVEAYAADDPASHSFGGPTSRNGVMFGPPGRLYVYRSYGVHWCANVVCGPEGEGAAVLLRALRPTDGVELMHRRRGVGDERLLCAGPGRLTQALGITGTHDGARVDRSPFRLRLPVREPLIEATPRIGITKASTLPWRYVVRESRWASRGPRRASS